MVRAPLADEHDPAERAHRERVAARAVRRQRVERAGLPDCPTCGGTEADVDDESLRCICEQERAALAARLQHLATEAYLDDPQTLADRGDRSDRIAP